jgi:cellulose synthase/poly-beta-1,6-N-acetylglucosamine synthase-like glycosyltransferase
VGYFLVLFIWKSLIKEKKIEKNLIINSPKVTHIIAAYNEEDIIEEKIKNSLELNYPKEKTRTIIVADGSDDKTVKIVKNYDEVELQFSFERRGKLASINRVIPLVDTEIIVFSDANSILSKNALSSMMYHFADDQVGAVAGEKRVDSERMDDAAGSGESSYWKYESLIKKWESIVSGTVGAAGELFAIRTQLYQSPPHHILTEDLIISSNVIKQGYKVKYEPLAMAKEKPSKNVGEEIKRKIRISTGALQSIPYLIPILNIFKYGAISLLLFSHKIMRWLVAPSALLLLFISSFLLLSTGFFIVQMTFYGQILFYLIAIIGWLLSSKSLKIKMLFWPFYFLLMHICIVIGYRNVLFGNNDVRWEKAERKID